MARPIRWLASTIGKRGYIARYLRAASPEGSVVIGTGNDRFTPGFMSCDKAVVLPAIREEGYLDSVLGLCEREGITAAICLSDLDISVLSLARNRMEEMGIACFFPEHETAMRWLDKSRSAQFLVEQGFDTPATFTDLETAISTVGFPLVIKPRKGSASDGFGIFEERNAALAHWSKIAEPMAQAYVKGRLVNVEACSDQNGRLMAVSVWERHSSVAGETLLAETIAHPAAIATTKALLAASPIPGPIDIDMIELADRLYVLEVNTRFGGGYPTSHLAGADFPAAMVNALEGRLPERLLKYRPGVLMMKELYPVAYDLSKVTSAVA